ASCCVMCDIFVDVPSTHYLYTLSLHDALPIYSVGYERYWSARKRRAWSDRISFRTIGPRVVPPALRAHAESTSRADSGCRASNAVRPNAATAMRTIRLRPSLTTSLDRVCRPDYLPSRFARPVPINEVE